MDSKAIIKGSTIGFGEESTLTETAIVPTENTQISDTTVSPEGNIQQQLTENTETNVPENTTSQEENNSNFDLGFSEEKSNEPQVNTQSQSTLSWKETLKKLSAQEKIEAAKELGFDDFDLNFSDARKRGVDPAKYIYAKAIDWNKVSDTDLLKNDYRSKFPNATPAQIDKLIARQYNQTDISDEEDKELGSLMMQADARKIREQKIVEANNFVIPEKIEPQTDENYAQFKKDQEQLNIGREGYKRFLAEHEATKNLLQNKRVAIPIGKDGKVFNINIDKPEAINTALTDNGTTWKKLMQNDKGEPDIFKQQMTILFAANPYKFIDDIFGYGKAQGMKSKIEENNNASREIGSSPRGNVVNMTEKEAWAKHARSSTLGGK